MSQAITLALSGVVRLYRLLVAPMLPRCCRFEPTCSQYALDALEKHGPFGGSIRIAGRLLRCQPLCNGGHDPA